MSDVFTKRKRSEVMSRIRGRGNKETEVALAKLLRMHGITGWRRNQPVFGKPDFVFPHARVAMFVDGCFWHGCPKHANMPANNRLFWKKKLTANKARDLVVSKTLQQAGWRVVRVWEHELAKRPQRCIERIKAVLDASNPSVLACLEGASESHRKGLLPKSVRTRWSASLPARTASGSK